MNDDNDDTPRRCADRRYHVLYCTERARRNKSRWQFSPIRTGWHTDETSVSTTIRYLAPTLLLDEADTLLRDNDDLRSIVNAGNMLGGGAPLRWRGSGTEGGREMRPSWRAPRL